jgi:hypothetical protein
MPRKTPRPGPPHRSQETVWVGGLRETPFLVEDRDPPYHPWVVFWFESPDGPIVGSQLVHPDDAQGAVGQTLRMALEQPLSGPPRRPELIRVATGDLASEVHAVVGDTVSIDVGPTPELDQLMAAMAESVGGPSDAGDDDPAYLGAGDVNPDSVARLFEAAERVHELAPWEVATEELLLRVDIPALGVNGGCLVVIGGLGENRGLILFDSVEVYDAFISLSELTTPMGPPPASDIGGRWLSLAFEAEDTLPASYPREAERHDWPVADAAAFPVLMRHERDLTHAPLTDRDVRIGAAVASAFSVFFVKHRHLFASAAPPPVCESYRDETDLEVRFCLPYEAHVRFATDDPPSATAPGGKPNATPPRPGRNEPCHCGSGRKYKRCCLRKDEAARRAKPAAPAAPSATWTPGPEPLIHRIMDHAIDRFGRPWFEHTRAFADVMEVQQLAVPWSVYGFEVDGVTAGASYLETHGHALEAAERAEIEAELAAWLSVWNVVDVERGVGVRVRDALTGETRWVGDVTSSRTAAVHDALLARVVDVAGVSGVAGKGRASRPGGTSIFSGLHPRPLPPVEAEEVVQRVRGHLRRKRDVPPERLRSGKVGRYLIKRWEEAVDDLDARHAMPPRTSNTDGDPIAITADVFAIADGREDALRARLADRDDVVPPAPGDDPDYTILHPDRTGSDGHGRLVVGHATIADQALTVVTNSQTRGDAVRARVEEIAGDLLSHLERRVIDPLDPEFLAAMRDDDPVAGEAAGGAAIPLGEAGGEAADGASGGAADTPGPEIRALELEFKQRHYATWADESLPALGGRTPREAVQTADGRREVDLLLRSMENQEHRNAGEWAFDFSVIRKQLGLD